MSRRRATWALAAACLGTFLAYAPALQNGFTFDDRHVAMAAYDDGRPNPMVAELRPLSEYFTSNYWKGTYDADGLYRPVTVLSYALTHALFAGGSEDGGALPQHVLNLVLHLLSVVLVYRLLRLLIRHRGPPLLGALVFGLHAIHTEAVATVVGRAELLAFCFGAAAVVLFARGKHAHRLPRHAAASLLLFFAFCSKESALAWVPFLLVFELARTWSRAPATTPGAGLRRHAGSVLAVSIGAIALFFTLRAVMLAGLPAAGEAATHSAAAVLPKATALMVWGLGLEKTLLPLGLACDYGPSVITPVTSLLDARLWGAALALAAALLGGCLWARRRPLPFLAMASFLGFSFLTSNLPITIGTHFGERLYYTPSLGLSFAIAWLAGILRGRTRSLGAALLTAWLLLSAVLCWQRSLVWRSNATLFGHDVVTQPRSGRIHYNWAKELEKRGGPGDEAAMKRHLQQAVQLDPDLALAWHDLGVLQIRAGRLERAEQSLRQGLAASEVARGDRLRLRINLAVALGPRDPGAAEAELRAALGEDPTGLADHLDEIIEFFTASLGQVRLRGLLQAAEARAPAAMNWARLRGTLAYRANDHAQAAQELRRALQRRPGDPRADEARLMLASSLAYLHRKPEALALTRKLLARPGLGATVREQARKLLFDLTH